MSRTWTLARRVAVVVLLALVVARPSFGSEEVETRRVALSVVLVVDRTKSMDALDVDGGPRFDRVRADLATLVDSLPEARFALVTFASGASLDLPFTSDRTVVSQALADLDLEEPVDASGSRLDRPLTEVIDLLEASRGARADRHTVLVLVGDGENTDGRRQASYAPVAGEVDDGVVLGYGTAEGGRMALAADADLSDGYVPDRSTGRAAVSRLDADNLRTVATQLGVPYVQRDRPAGIEEVVARLSDADPTASSTTLADRDLTWLFALGLLGLLLLELRASWRALLALWRDGRVAT